MSLEYIEILSKPYVPQPTKANTKWAIWNFNKWMKWRNEQYPDDLVPEDILVTGSAKVLNKWLSLYDPANGWLPIPN